MQTNKGGRPFIKLTQEQINQIPTLAKVGLSQEQMADYLGICKNAFRSYLERYQEVNELYKKARAEMFFDVSNNLYQKAISKDPSHNSIAIFFAKTQLGWKETQIVESTNYNFNTEVELTLEQQEEALNKRGIKINIDK